jgi:hypothetical protein
MTGPPVAHVKRQPNEGGESNRLFAPRRIHLKLVGQDGPWANLRYELWDGESKLGRDDARTSDEGVVFQLVGATVEKVTLKVWFYHHETPHEFILRVAPLPAIDTPEGLLHRLQNLGAGCTTTVEAHHVILLQRAFGMTETGVADEAFKARVLEMHGG